MAVVGNMAELITPQAKKGDNFMSEYGNGFVKMPKWHLLSDSSHLHRWIQKCRFFSSSCR